MKWGDGMELKFDKKTLRNIALWGLLIIAVYWILHDAERVSLIFDKIGNLFAPFVVGAVLAFIFNVPMRSFERLLKSIKNNGWRRAIAVILTLLCVAIVLAGVIMLLVPQLIITVESVEPKIVEFVGKVVTQIEAFLVENPDIQNWIIETFNLASFDLGAMAEKFLDMLGSGINTLFPQAVSAIGSLASGLFSAFVSVAFAIYALFQKETLARQGRKILYAVLPEKASDYIVRVLRLSNSTFSNFLSGQCVEVCILGTMFAITMTIFGMPYVPLISVLIAVTAFIPVVGAWVGCIVGAFLILMANPLQAVWFVIMFVILQMLENNLIYPRVVGTSVGLSGMWVLVAITIGGEISGIAGMFLMIPLVSVVYTLFREWVNGRVAKLEIAPEKLEPQPPELFSHFKEKRKKTKEKIAKKKEEKKAQKGK